MRKIQSGPFLSTEAPVSPVFTLAVLLAMGAANLLAPVNAQAGGDACQDLCSQYHSGIIAGQNKGDNQGSGTTGLMSLGYVNGQCGPMPTGSPSGTPSGPLDAVNANSAVSDAARGVDPSSCAVSTCDSDWDKCFHALQAQWGQFAQRCQAIDFDNSAHDGELSAAIGYTIAFAVCTTACATEATPAGPAFKVACLATGIGAMVDDLAATGVVASKTKSIMGNWGSSAATSAVTGLGATAGIVVSAAADVAGDASKRANDSCFAAFCTGASATMKWRNYVTYAGMADGECDTLQTFVTGHPLPSPEVNANPSPPPLGPPGTSQVTGGAGVRGSGAHGGGSGGSGASSSKVPASVAASVAGFPNSAQFAKATAGDVFQPIYGSIGGKDKMADAFKNATGMTPADLADKLASGQSPSQSMAGSGNEAATAGMAELEKIVKNGDLDGKNGPLAAGSGSGAGIPSSGGAKGGIAGGGAAKAPSNPFGMFGMKGPGNGDAPTETTFEKAKRAVASADSNGDVFHEGFGGTIFQIISTVLNKSRDRIDLLEWETPLNRALVGLPAKKKAAGR